MGSASRATRTTLEVHAVGATATKRFLTKAPTFVVGIETAVGAVEVRGARFTIDRSSCLVIPARARFTISAESAARIATIGFEPPTFDAVERSYQRLGFDRERFDGWLAIAAVLPRTVWVHEIVHRLVFERWALGETDNQATRFLEVEILKEIYFLLRDRDAGAERSTIVQKRSAVLERAVAFIEAHVLEPINVATLARAAGASERTLSRTFRRELSTTPAAYWRTRKLDEALVLLRAGRDSVAEVAAKVGYENPTAFGHAFRLRFNRPPSAFRPRARVRPAPKV
ncbi:MAG: AraC family transcriptional regulator [Deltaproteobacteria bacterium]